MCVSMYPNELSSHTEIHRKVLNVDDQALQHATGHGFDAILGLLLDQPLEHILGRQLTYGFQFEYRLGLTPHYR